MKRLLVIISALLLAVPLGLSARHVVKHHAAQAQAPRAANANCAFGVTPPANTSCSISDYTAATTALTDSNAFAICTGTTSGACFASSPTITYHQTPLSGLSTYILGKFSATSPITYNSLTGVIACPTCGTSTGGLTGLTVGPGLTVVPGTYNTGTGAPATLVNGSNITPQFFYEAHATSYTVAATDGAKLLESTTTAGNTYTLPTPGAAGSTGYSFSTISSATAVPLNYNITTPSGIIYGCSAPAATISVGFDVTVVPTGSNWKCSSSNVSTQIPVTWGPGMNLATSPAPVWRRPLSLQVLNVICVPGVPASGTATLDVWLVPEGTSSANVTTCVGCTNLTPSHCNAAGASGITQNALGTFPVVQTSGGVFWLVGTGAGWGTSTTASGLIQIATLP